MGLFATIMSRFLPHYRDWFKNPKRPAKPPAINPAPQGQSAEGRNVGRSADNPLLDYADQSQLDVYRGEGYVGVLSSWLAALKWVPDVGGANRLLLEVGPSETGTIYIKKRDGKVMVYSGVPKSVFDDFLIADSHGEFYNRYVKPAYTFVGTF